jgi:mRNA interferase HigB
MFHKMEFRLFQKMEHAITTIVRIIASTTLATYARKHPDAAKSLAHWHNVARTSKWASSSEVQAAFPKAKVLNGERVRFDVSVGDYRLIVAFDFRRKIAFIKFIGTHAEYDPGSTP